MFIRATGDVEQPQHAVGGYDKIRDRVSGSSSDKVLDGVPNVFYRYVQCEVATTDDFLSQGAKGFAPREPISVAARRAWDEGISIYDDFDHACAIAPGLRFRPGRFIATLELPGGHSLEIVQTGRDKHHYTIFGTPEELLALVSGVPVLIPGAPED